MQHGLRVDHHVLPQLQLLGEAAVAHLALPLAFAAVGHTRQDELLARLGVTL